MRFFKKIQGYALLAAVLLMAAAGYGQTAPVKSQEVSEADGIPVIIKHLPNWEAVKASAAFINNPADLQKAVGDRPVLSVIDFSGGTEAAAASYPEGKLLIVEYATPQGSAYADEQVRNSLAASPQGSAVVYRRIGNYNAFVFDAADESAARALLDQVKYEKKVQWLGENPFEFRRMERAFIYMTRDMFIATVLWIVLGIITSIAVGVGIGYVYFLFREKQRSRMTAFSDAGGLTRLNLDDLSEPVLSKWN